MYRSVFNPSRTLRLALCLWATAPLLPAQLAPDVASVKKGLPVAPIQPEALRLVRENGDPAFITTASAPMPEIKDETRGALTLDELDLSYNGGRQAAPTARLKETSTGVVELEPFVVGAEKIPDLSPLRENPLEKFIRTGTLAQHVGKNVTTKLWIKGDEGIMLRFSW